ncbi:uncharacterized protein LOC131155175 isoform X2 [Malania oleifera]|uniref:uncharacterized protein LOC131155175 isoform X2 n=1 Tax=Malania oleifera TaxID=397392 RepID=UPI0025AEACE5|nr:uncharacterized protein LOC131155175 isoform X2 [Malania oleifera]
MANVSGDPHSIDASAQSFADADFISSLQSQLESLRQTVKELEVENMKLSSQIENCRCCCHEVKGNFNCTDVDDAVTVEKTRQLQASGDKLKKKKLVVKMAGDNAKMMHHYSKRFVALKVMYFGQRFYGFASEAQMEPTVESEIFRALEKTKLLFGDKKEVQYSRCGRTDKGVSSVGQVIALFLRSNLKEADTITSNGSSGKIVSEEQYEDEVDYVRVLNRVLPKDIRVMGWCPAPIGFNARFSCLIREYKYIFWRENLNVMAMESAAKKFVGEHDFRNFCKMDAVNVHNYRRHVSSFKISPLNKRFEGNELWAMKIKGSAFLWHQVRCMVAVLFMIGQGLESPNVIDALLDIDSTPRKPQYIMAPEIPLILQSCEFENLKFTCSSDARKALRRHFENEYQTYQLHAAIFKEALLACSSLENDQSSLNNGAKKGPSHIPLMSRASEPSYEERCAKLKSRVCDEEQRVLHSCAPVWDREHAR